MTGAVRTLAVLGVAMLALAACGKKPAGVSAPEGADPYAYPKHYPDAGTDPQPTYKNP